MIQTRHLGTVPLPRPNTALTMALGPSFTDDSRPFSGDFFLPSLVERSLAWLPRLLLAAWLRRPLSQETSQFNGRFAPVKTGLPPPHTADVVMTSLMGESSLREATTSGTSRTRGTHATTIAYLPVSSPILPTPPRVHSWLPSGAN